MGMQFGLLSRVSIAHGSRAQSIQAFTLRERHMLWVPAKSLLRKRLGPTTEVAGRRRNFHSDELRNMTANSSLHTIKVIK
jgi:hypothetical protein